MISPKNNTKTKQRRAVAGAALNSDINGVCGNASITNPATREEPTLDREKLDPEISQCFYLIVERFAPGKRNNEGFRLAGALTIRLDTQDWVDIKAGAYGKGAISLCAHLFKISENEAAWRLARWFAVAVARCDPSIFLAGITLQTKQVTE
jgi:hypothetical protein